MSSALRSSSLVAQMETQPAGSGSLRIGQWVNGTESVHLIFSRRRADSPQRLLAFNAAVGKLRANGELQALELRHVPRPPNGGQR